MGICQSGVDCTIQPGRILVDISENHPLVQLGQVLPWRDLVELVLPDLKKTSAGSWWRGRKLKIRIHLGVYICSRCLTRQIVKLNTV